MVTLVYISITQLLIGVAISELGNVENGLVYHLTKCIVPHKDIRVKKNLDVAGNNVFDVFQQISFCWKTTLHRCNDHYKNDYINKIPMCGFLNTGMQLVPYYWMLKVHSEFVVHVTLLEFHLPSSVTCHHGAVLVESFRNPNTGGLDIVENEHLGQWHTTVLMYMLQYLLLNILKYHMGSPLK